MKTAYLAAFAILLASVNPALSQTVGHVSSGGDCAWPEIHLPSHGANCAMVAAFGKDALTDNSLYQVWDCIKTGSVTRYLMKLSYVNNPGREFHRCPQLDELHLQR